MFFIKLRVIFLIFLLPVGGLVSAGAKPEKKAASFSPAAGRIEAGVSAPGGETSLRNSGVFPAANSAAGRAETEAERGDASGAVAEAESAAKPGAAETPETLPQPPGAEPTRAELVMKALASAYPGRVGQAEFRGGDWAVPVYGKWFYYAEGRLLPEELRSSASDYSSYPFYNYMETLPPWREPTDEESERMRGMRENRRSNPRKRSQHFFDTLLRAGNRSESWERVKTIRFLGFPVMVHYSVMEPLSLVEEKILLEAKTNPTVKQWISDLNSVDSWNWRNIAESSSRSFHSYGAAIDLLPKSTKGLATYWLWSADIDPEWWKIPYSKRLHPPGEVVRAFESYGFIWGGKWTVYDTMHFEYRPEILIFSKIPLARFR